MCYYSSYHHRQEALTEFCVFDPLILVDPPAEICIMLSQPSLPEPSNEPRKKRAFTNHCVHLSSPRNEFLITPLWVEGTKSFLAFLFGVTYIKWSEVDGPSE